MADDSEMLPGERECEHCGGGGSVNGPNDGLVTCPECNGDGFLIGPKPAEPLPYGAAVTINSLVHLVQLRWDGYEDMIPALNDDDLAALNACFGTDWGGRGMGWDCDRPAAVTIRELGEAQTDTDDPYWQSLAELHASRKCPDCGGPADHFRWECRAEAAALKAFIRWGPRQRAVIGKFMCPHCGYLFGERAPDGRYWEEVPAHDDETVVPGRRPGMYVCPGAGEVWRNPLTDSRPLGNGEANPHYQNIVECVDEGHRWELVGSEWPTRCPFCEDLS